MFVDIPANADIEAQSVLKVEVTKVDTPVSNTFASEARGLHYVYLQHPSQLTSSATAAGISRYPTASMIQSTLNIDETGQLQVVKDNEKVLYLYSS